MSLYYEAAQFLSRRGKEGGFGGSSLSRVYADKTTIKKSKPTNIYALLSESIKWSDVLSRIVEDAEILKHERKLNPALALLLAHDLLLAKNGVAAPKDHALRLAIERHKARLSAEFTKARIKAGFASLQAWKDAVNAKTSHDNVKGEGDNDPEHGVKHARWIRVNTLRSSLDSALSTTFSEYDCDATLGDVLRAQYGKAVLAVDEHVPDLVALPSHFDFSKSRAYTRGQIIFQDKASCFPAYMLDPTPDDGDIIDACAAPGNKTTHLAALLDQRRSSSDSTSGQNQTIFACERDKDRAAILEKMVVVAGADKNGMVQCLAGQDFLRLNPQSAKWRRVGALLLDPSCSGSGIIGRGDVENTEEAHPAVLPRMPLEGGRQDKSKRMQGKKRKRHLLAAENSKTTTSFQNETPVNEAENQSAAAGEEQATGSLSARLTALSNFQTSLLQHAFAFPAAKKVVYSTCSLYAEENEHVVLRALLSSVAKKRGWRLCRREEQVKGMREWNIRGDEDALANILGFAADRESRSRTGPSLCRQVAEASVRCEKGSDKGTMGFFVAKFVRDAKDAGEYENGQETAVDAGSDEWEGFSDSSG